MAEGSGLPLDQETREALVAILARRGLIAGQTGLDAGRLALPRAAFLRLCRWVVLAGDADAALLALAHMPGRDLADLLATGRSEAAAELLSWVSVDGLP